MSDMPDDGAEIMRQFVPNSPFASHCGLRIEELEPDRAVLRLPYAPQLATMGETVHGGALATALDTAAMAASWSGVTPPPSLRGSTIALSISYLAPASGVDLLVEARVTRRGRSVCHVDCVARDPDGAPVAQALAAYRLG